MSSYRSLLARLVNRLKSRPQHDRLADGSVDVPNLPSEPLEERTLTAIRPLPPTPRADKRRRRNDWRSHALAAERLEDRRMLATYTWDGAGTLSITLQTNDDLTISEAAGTRTFMLSAGATFTQV